MRALVVDAPGRYGLRDVETPATSSGEVLVRSTYVALCGTDVKILRGDLPEGTATYPCIPGHEWSGIVEAVGSDVHDLAPGVRVVSEGMLWCGRCARCLGGQTNLCENYAQLGFTRPGGFGAYVVTPRRVVHPLPETVSLEAAALIEPLSVLVHAFDRGRVASADSLGIVGLGGLGSVAILLARALGVRRVVGFGIRQSERSLAEGLGADEVVDLSTGGASREYVDVVIETSGAASAVRSAIGVLKRGGRLLLVGTAGEGSSIVFSDDEILRRELEVIGSLSYTAAAWLRALDLAGRGEPSLERIITHRLPIERYGEALDIFDTRDQSVGRIVLTHQG